MGKVIAFLVLMLVAPAAYAVNYTVGNSSGWNTGVDYNAWATGQTFTTADALVFNYGPTHAVHIVANAEDYFDCDDDMPRGIYRTSPTTIQLNVTGPWYFICPTDNHCEAGQRLTVNVTAAASIPPAASPPPSGGSVPPTPAGTPPGTPPSMATPPGTPPSMATPPPPPPSAAAGLKVGLISLVMAALTGLLV
ncbi:hypothetical protein CASFOL_041741 [Castilleja foliolosa]|uniref:Phytocyanin domain-containing protein n=1 Tax=Castilleja foliolosa TaxID=1961234 RepID=A0ABD3B9R6_9LAMI